MNEKPYTVSELNFYIKNLIDSDKILSKVFVTAEISNFKASPTGHFYFTLKDKFSEISCVMFKNYHYRLKFLPENGLKVNIFGKVAVYQPKGTYQILVEEISPAGLGELHLKIEQLKKKLAGEGLFSEVHKKNIPAGPRKIGVVTSLQGSVIHDIVNTLNKRNDSVGIIISPAVVQGSLAEASIAEAIERLNRYKEVDLIIVARGGGSFEDLMPFNSEKVARAIFNSNIPVISAVGHETDFTISDMAADLRALTPTYAAQACVKSKEELEGEVRTILKRLELILKGRLDKEKIRLSEIIKRIKKRSPGITFSENQQRLDSAVENLFCKIKNILNNNYNKLNYLKKHLNALSPYGILKRGYSITWKLPEREIVKSSGLLKESDLIQTQFFAGSTTSEVVGKEEV